jgi:N-hydroxyarylamine O-acetyltransferase
MIVFMLLDTYLDRIGYKGPRAPMAESLRALHRRHMLTVPFENLDIGLGRKIVLDPERFFDKIVSSNRGGFCYELNGAFASLLTALGFRVDMLSARVANEQRTPSEEFDHLALRVEAEGIWLADVGFGDNFLGPLRFTSGVEQQDSVAGFRLTDVGERWQLERRQPDRSWRLVYDLSPQPRDLGEFADRCHYHQTSSKSHFTRNRICSLAKRDGRITLSDTRLIINSSGIRQEQVVASEVDWRLALRDYFGVVLG